MGGEFYIAGQAISLSPISQAINTLKKEIHLNVCSILKRQIVGKSYSADLLTRTEE